MKTVWKWILGIVVFLVVVGVVVGAVFLWHSHAMNAFVRRAQPFTQQGPFNPPNNRPSPNNNNGGPFYRGPMMHRNFGFPMMGGRGFMRYGFFPFGMGFFMIGAFLRLLLPLGVLALVAFLFYQLGKHAGASRAAAAAIPAPVVSEPTPVEAPAEPKRGRSRKTE